MADKRTVLTPILSDRTPHRGQAINAIDSSANPSVPTASPTPFFFRIKSVTTKDMEEFRNTKNDIEKKHTPMRYVAACSRVTVNISTRLDND